MNKNQLGCMLYSIKFKYMSIDFLKAKLDLINEQKSPLFRIMSIYDDDKPQKRKFSNNICAFHIGQGYILSVAHNLRISELPPSISEKNYQEILKALDDNQKISFDKCYLADKQEQKRYLDSTDQSSFQQIINIINQINYDFRFISQYKNKTCKPFLVIQFRDKNFYKNNILTKKINPNHIFHETILSRHTFLIELKLVEAYYNEDISIYKIVNTDKEIINIIPSLDIDYNIYDKTNKNYFCLQSAPVDNLGRLLNEASIEGLLDHWNSFADKIGGNYIMDGLRYLIKGYFRFGSSGAPYLIYDYELNKFKVNAIQSEACPIQLSINNNRNGNFQYINAIATPLKSVKNKLNKILGGN